MRIQLQCNEMNVRIAISLVLPEPLGYPGVVDKHDLLVILLSSFGYPVAATASTCQGVGGLPYAFLTAFVRMILTLFWATTMAVMKFWKPHVVFIVLVVFQSSLCSN